MAEESKNRVFKAMALTTTISMEIAITVTLGFFSGRFLDRKLATEPWLMIAGILLGMGLGIWGIVQTLERFFNEKE